MTRLRGALLLLLAPAAAWAQPPPDQPPSPAPPPTTPTEPVPTDTTTPTPPPPVVPAPPTEPTYSMQDRTYHTVTTEERGRPFANVGFAVSLGGGVSGFTSDSAREATNDGGGWDVRAIIGTRTPVAAEISYLGSAQSISALGLDDNAVLVGNGVQADVRLNLTTDKPLQPFLFAGAAWRRYDLANVDTNTSDVSDQDNVIEFPVGAGIAYHYRGFLLDARGEFRPATNEDLMPSLTQDGITDDNQASLHRWGVNANIGYEF